MNDSLLQAAVQAARFFPKEDVEMALRYILEHTRYEEYQDQETEDCPERREETRDQETREAG